MPLERSTGHNEVSLHSQVLCHLGITKPIILTCLSFSLSFTDITLSRRSPWGAEMAAASLVLGNSIHRGQGFWEGSQASAVE